QARQHGDDEVENDRGDERCGGYREVLPRQPYQQRYRNERNDAERSHDVDEIVPILPAGVEDHEPVNASRHDDRDRNRRPRVSHVAEIATGTQRCAAFHETHQFAGWLTRMGWLLAVHIRVTYGPKAR